MQDGSHVPGSASGAGTAAATEQSLQTRGAVECSKGGLVQVDFYG